VIDPSFTNVVEFARSQAEKPYLIGQVGPHEYDCSGLVSALVNVAMGQYPHRRLFATSTLGTTGCSGLVPGTNGAFQVGSRTGSPYGHMAATVNGINMECSTSYGVRVGGKASGAFDFPNRFVLKGPIITPCL
jgi:hypothetical protein